MPLNKPTTSWWASNGYIVIALIGYGAAVIAFAMNIKDRVDHMEQYGSPQVATLDKRLALIELQLNQNSQLQHQNSDKLDMISKNLNEHIFKLQK